MKPILHRCKPFFILMRFNKPIGILLLLWPTLWALWIAASGIPPLPILLIFILGVCVMRSAGCVINDIADRKFDGAVSRTRDRPLVVGTVSTKEALILFVGLCTLGFLLVLNLNEFTIKLSVIGVLLATLYPFTKRMIHLPQVVLGAAFAFAVPMAFAAISGTISTVGWWLYGIALVWPVAYDSIYALMDKEDDLKIGIKSTAIFFGKLDIAIISLLYLSVITGLFVVGHLLHFNGFYDLCVLIALLLMGYQIYLIKGRTYSNYHYAFHSNHWVGLIIFLGIIFNY